MKTHSIKSIAKLFKGCHIDEFGIVDGCVHYFFVRTPKGGSSTYKFDVTDINEYFNNYIGKVNRTPKMWDMLLKDRKRMDNIRIALMTLIDDDTRIPACNQEEARAILNAVKGIA